MGELFSDFCCTLDSLQTTKIVAQQKQEVMLTEMSCEILKCVPQPYTKFTSHNSSDLADLNQGILRSGPSNVLVKGEMKGRCYHNHN